MSEDDEIDDSICSVRQNKDGTYDVVAYDGTIVASAFQTHAGAYVWLDRNSRQGREAAEVHNRIRSSRRFSQGEW